MILSIGVLIWKIYLAYMLVNQFIEVKFLEKSVEFYY